MTPMFIQEPFWNLTLSMPQARYVGINDKYAFLPKELEERGVVIQGDLGKILTLAAQDKQEEGK